MREGETISGFGRPRSTQDKRIAELYAKYELGEAPSLRDIEPVATELLSDLPTALDGAKLVLGRQIDSSLEKESKIITLVTNPRVSGKDKFGILLMRRADENM